MKSNSFIKANIEIIKENIETKEIRTVRTHNLVVNVGLNQIRDLLLGSTGIILPTHIGIGTSTDAVTAGDTTLGSEVVRDSFSGSTSLGVGSMQFTYYLSSSQAGGNDIAEIGAFNSSSTSADMFARAVIPTDTKTTSEAWSFIWEFTVTATT